MLPASRDRLGWWALVVGLAVALAYVASSFVGVLVLGLFGYYATRPIRTRLAAIVDSNRIAATLTVLVVLVPVLLVFVYAGVRLVHDLQQLVDGTAATTVLTHAAGLDRITDAERAQFRSILRAPATLVRARGETIWSDVQTGLTALQALVGTVILLALSVTLSYVLLANDEAVSDALVEVIGGRDTAAYAYCVAVDRDLESVFFGNLLFALVMTVVATAAYGATNALAPPALHVPMVLVLGFLTGVASLIPIVVGKVVYLPVVAYLGLQAVRSGDGGLAFVGGVLVAYVLLLDLVPQSLVQPIVSGRRVNAAVLLFAYVLGPILFGWYGFFLLPIVFVLALEAVRIVLPELIQGDAITPRATIASGVGADPQAVIDDVPGSEADADSDSGTDDEGSGEPTHETDDEERGERADDQRGDESRDED